MAAAAVALAEPPSAFADGVAVVELAGLSLLVVVVAVAGVWIARDLPATLKELGRAFADWVAVHEVIRRVDCRPWGLDKEFVISQDGATTSPANDALCSWASVSGRRYEYGLVLWNGALALSRMLLEQRESLGSSAFSDGRTVLELGCGQALVSMVVVEAFPGLRRVVVTDGCNDVLLAAEENLTKNLSASAAERLHMLPLVWARPSDIEEARALNSGGAFDVILGADVTYMEETDDFVDTIVELSHGGTHVWISHEPRRHPTEGLVARLRAAFRSVEESQIVLTAQEVGRDEAVAITIWHCADKLAA